jgi:hypothetical protein
MSLSHALTQEERIQLAINFLKFNPTCSQRQAAKKFSVPPSTLGHRLHGRGTLLDHYESQQRLTVAEEASLIHCISRIYVWGWPMRIPLLELMARDLLLAKGDRIGLGQH